MSSGLPARPAISSPTPSGASLSLRERIGDRVIAAPISRPRRGSPPRSPRREREYRELSPPRHYMPPRRDERDRNRDDGYRHRSPPPLARRDEPKWSERDSRERDYGRRPSRSDYHDRLEYDERSPPRRRPSSPRREFRAASPRRPYRSPSPGYSSRHSRRPSPPYSRPPRRSRSPRNPSSFRRPSSPYRRAPSPYRRRSRSPVHTRSPRRSPPRRQSPSFPSQRARSPQERDIANSTPTGPKSETHNDKQVPLQAVKRLGNFSSKPNSNTTLVPSGRDEPVIIKQELDDPMDVAITSKGAIAAGSKSSSSDERPQDDTVVKKEVAPPTGPRRHNVMARTNLVPRAIPTKPRADRSQTTDPTSSALRASEMRSREVLTEKSPAIPAITLPSASQKRRSPGANTNSLPPSHSASPQPPSGPRGTLLSAMANSPESTKSQNEAVPVAPRRSTPQGPKGMGRNISSISVQQPPWVIDLPLVKKPDFLEAQELEILKIHTQRKALQKTYEGVEIACDRAAYELDIATNELQAAETRRVLAEEQLERAIAGKPLMDQSAIQV